MRQASMTLYVAVTAVVMVILMPHTEATLSLGVLPAVASVGGLAALKVLKYVGLSKLQETVSNSGLDALTDLDDSGNDYYSQQPPIYVAAPPPTYIAPPAPYYPPPLPLSTPPAFFIVPASSFQDFSRSRRDLSKVRGPGAAGVVAVRSEKEYFDVIGSLDEGRCVLRAVCEVAGAPLHTLTEDEKTIMAAFSAPYQLSRGAPGTLRGKYHQAAWVGRTASDATTTCAKMYSSCPVPARELLRALKAEKQQKEEPSRL